MCVVTIVEHSPQILAHEEKAFTTISTNGMNLTEQNRMAAIERLEIFS